MHHVTNIYFVLELFSIFFKIRVVFSIVSARICLSFGFTPSLPGEGPFSEDVCMWNFFAVVGFAIFLAHGCASVLL